MTMRLFLPLIALFAAGVLAARAPEAQQTTEPGFRLTSRSLPAMPVDIQLKAGDTLVTGDGEQKRVRLPDRSLVYVRQGTSLNVTKAGALELTAGEVFVETAIGKLAPAVTVRTPKRILEARDSRFGVRATKDGTSVLVATGSVKVNGLDAPVRGGEQLEASAEKPNRARVAHQIAWTREMRNACPLVPGSDHAGGTLVAVDPDGQETKLELRRYHVDVHIEDGFARTTIDQTYFNHAQDRLEGTFRFPLPPDASLSRLAMYVDGKLMEGGMAERDHARAVYEKIVWEKRDPALLEWVDGSTFKMRVFPLEARQEKRIVLSYSQRLPVMVNAQTYRFPAGHSMSEVGTWSLNVRVKDGKGMTWQCESHNVHATNDNNDLVLKAELKKARLDRDVTLTLVESKSEEVRFSATRFENANYLMVRYRPELAAPREPQRRDWVILAETSGDRDPLLARTQIELIRAFLHNAGREDTFVILTGGTRTKALRPRALRNDLVTIDEVLADLEKAHLIGAFDLNAALVTARTHLESAKNPYLVHVGSGIPAMGERTPAGLLGKLPKGTRYVGVGVGRRWDRALMQTMAEKTGGYFTQVNPDESIGWRGLELASTLDTPRLLDVSVSDPDGKAKFLTFARMVSGGEEVAAVARTEEALPEKVRITGLLEGKEYSQDVTVKGVKSGAGYLPRSWAKLEIDRLLADDAAKHKEKVVSLSKSMVVMTPFTSLLVLENDDMYKQYKVDRGRKDHWAMYPAPEKIAVVYEPLDGEKDAKGIKPTRTTVANTVVARRPGSPVEEARKRAWLQREYQLNRLSQGAVARDEAKPLSVRGLGTRNYVNYNFQSLRSQLGGFDLYSARNEALARQLGTPAKDWNVEYNPITGERLTPLDDIPLNYNLDRIEEVSVPGRLGRTSGLEAFPPALGLIIRDEKRLSRETVDLAAQLSGTERGTLTGSLMFGLAVESDGLLRGADRRSVLRDARGGAVRDGQAIYGRHFAGNDRIFYDLVSYAPGLNTSAADLLAVLDAEARPDPRSKLGRIDPKAKELLDSARNTSNWRSYTAPATGLSAGFTIAFDRARKFAWERTLPSGLKEKVICDGITLHYIYPELGLASKRTVSRHHRLDFGARVPFVVPYAEDIARGADLVLVDASTVALVPHGAKDAKKYAELRLVFADGRIRERQLIEMPAKKVWRREVYAKDGSWKIVDSEGKELLVVKGKLTEGDTPALKADTDKFVVLDLPHRTPATVRQRLGVNLQTSHATLTFAQATQLMVTYATAGEGEVARSIFTHALANRDQRQIGYYVLLASAGVNLDSDNLDVLDAHPHEPLAHYLSLHSSPTLRKHASRWAATSNVWGDGMLRRLGQGHALLQRWSSGKALGTTATQRASERKRALDYVTQYKHTDLAWALLGLMQDRTIEEKNDDLRKKGYVELAKAYESFAESAFGDLARYERARCLWRGGEGDESRKLFAALYREARKEGALLRIDAEFKRALLDSDKGEWGELMRETATDLLDKKDRVGVMILAAQCHQLEDSVLSRRLLAMALKDLPVKGDDNLRLYLSAIGWLRNTDQNAEADRLVKMLLADADHAKKADLWRVASELAEKNNQPARELECKEKALALAYDAPGEVVNLQQVRSDYNLLLHSYAHLATALVALKQPIPAGFRERVIRAADRWRALDRDQSEACRMAAEILRYLGDRELAFDYLTTPVGLNPGESDAWVSMASTLAKQGERDLADRAYASAFDRESTNAQILWDRAENLRRAGRTATARSLYEQIAKGDWQPRFASLKQQAKWMTEERE